jgi:hypothetical protein
MNASQAVALMDITAIIQLKKCVYLVLVVA